MCVECHEPEEYSLVAKAVSKVLLVKKALDHLLTESFHKNRFHFFEFLTKGAESKIAPPRPELSKFVCQTNLLRTGGFLDCGIAIKRKSYHQKKNFQCIVLNVFFSKMRFPLSHSCLDQSEVDPHPLSPRVSAPGFVLVVEHVPQPHAELPGGKRAETLCQVEVSLDLRVESVSLV